MAEYLLNAWYAAAFADEVGETPYACVLLDTPVVIYRRGDGAPVMLADRCPHRFAPLSLGRRIGDEIQCPYHGLRFDEAGRCTFSPHGRAPPQGARVRAFPVMEKYGLIWFWPGEPERADPALAPRIDFLEEPDRFKVIKGRLHVQANYQLIGDNLLDLSHAAYIHPQFGGGERTPEQLLAATEQRLERRGDAVVNHRMRHGLPAPPDMRRLFGYDGHTPVHRRTTMVWRPPAILEFLGGVWGLDQAERDGAHIPQLHLVTPETEFTSHYLFLNGRNRRRDDPEVDQALLDMFTLAFRDQDEPMIEAVQRRMGRVSDINALKPVLLATDAAPVAARRVLAKLISTERAQAAPPPG